MIENNDVYGALVLAIIGAAVGWIKAYIEGRDNGVLTDLLRQINPYSTTTNIPEDSRIGDGLWKIGDNQKDEILEGLDVAERTAILSYIATMENARMKSYKLETSKGTFTIENGYIEDRPKIEPRIIYSSGERIGQFRFLRFEQQIGEKLDAINTDRNRIFAVVQPFNIGAMVLGIKVGSEPEKVRSFDAFESKDLHQEIPVWFKLYDYSPTVAGDTVNITIKQGYKRTAENGVTSVVWTEEETHTLPIKK